MAYKVVIGDGAADFVRGLSPKVQRQILKRLDLLAADPFPRGAIYLQDAPYRRVRSGDYRILYQVDRKTMVVNVAAIGDRKDIYDDL